MDDLFADVRFALRNFRRVPTFFSLVMGILALGIGVSVSIFSLVDGVLVRPAALRGSATSRHANELRTQAAV